MVKRADSLTEEVTFKRRMKGQTGISQVKASGEGGSSPGGRSSVYESWGVARSEELEHRQWYRDEKQGWRSRWASDDKGP